MAQAGAPGDPPNGPALRGADEGDIVGVPFEVAPETGGERDQSRATFLVPAGAARLLCQQPISARGALFDLRPVRAGQAPHGQEAVFTVFYSPKPDRTAAELAKRIARRLEDPEGARNAEGQCSVC
mmetsp:Transcript_48060/g.111345  ORF Transcript_48060/g.111345 Transcript_48060/m.111345 type:complete len:126 (+) Transcript_48060:53-430(+)